MLLNSFSLSEMFDLHSKRYEWEHDGEQLMDMFTNFDVANIEINPICLFNKDWDEIKLDLMDIATNYKRGI